MTLSLFCVFLAFLLIYANKIPVAVAMAKSSGGYDNRHPRNQQQNLTGWGARALAAHINSFEIFPAFAASAIIAHLTAPGTEANWLSVIFVVSRLVYSVLYIVNLHLLRSTVWAVGMLCVAGLFLLPLY